MHYKIYLPMIVPVSTSLTLKVYPVSCENIGELSLTSSVVTTTISDAILDPSETIITSAKDLSEVVSKSNRRVVTTSAEINVEVGVTMVLIVNGKVEA